MPFVPDQPSDISTGKFIPDQTSKTETPKEKGVSDYLKDYAKKAFKNLTLNRNKYGGWLNQYK